MTGGRAGWLSRGSSESLELEVGWEDLAVHESSTQTGPVAWGLSCKDGVRTKYWVPTDRGPYRRGGPVMGSMARA